ncbi:SDR family NAD(P)-dependent oxidoreductase [Roseomonas sp. SSH11]|uniref:SDR family NAD(P)-dependent oxidoreductase n=1 Tax=Pararoseomonas baculiformis TaxID=2820812 RepID=A0ABS4AHX2_9PROT|nr:SDR family NAD(P)-dependent oxidoreductase [Pararoseomonas baculiformis]MBP0446624.1 SDR family NAD(P)-dependent oxidoreductase [Pararoseomonas baculiformis]
MQGTSATERDPWPWRRVAITGASSGLGAALAQEVAAPGRHLHLSGRDAARLSATARACRAAGAEVRETVFDVTDAKSAEAWIAGMEGLDLLIANAGTSAGTGGTREAPDQVARIFAVNLTGALNTILPALEMMRAQAPGPDGIRGRVAAISSIAAFMASPGAPAYCASKAALQRWTEATDATARHDGIRLHAICPGFIRTPMTAPNTFPMPFLMEPGDAARRTLSGIARGKARVVFPRSLYAAARLGGALPAAWLSRLPAKAAPPEPPPPPPPG